MDGITRDATAPEPQQVEAEWLEARLGRQHARRRAHLEALAEPPKAAGRLGAHRYFWNCVEATIPRVLKASGLLARGRTNATRIEISRNTVRLPRLPQAFHGYTLLHLTDLHADISTGAMRALPGAIAGLHYDACVITGDFRGRTFGPFDRSLDLVREIVALLPGPVFGVLGNHDTARMIPGLEAMGIRMLVNESQAIERGAARLWIAGVDDPHHYRLDDMRQALAGIPKGDATVLLAHSTDGLDRAMGFGVGLMLSGHTHGGQICLPGSLPVLTSSRMPRRFVSGRWRHGGMHGYTARGVGTSAVDVRFNCRPEVTLHTLVVP